MYGDVCFSPVGNADTVVVVVVDVARRGAPPSVVGIIRDRRLYTPVGIVVDAAEVAEATNSPHEPRTVVDVRARRLYAPVGTANIAAVVAADDVSRRVDTKRINVPIRARRILTVGIVFDVVIFLNVTIRVDTISSCGKPRVRRNFFVSILFSGLRI